MNDQCTKLIQDIQISYSPFHTMQQMKKELLEGGFIQLLESEAWNLKPQGKYFVMRNQSSIIAFTLPKTINNFHFQMAAAHVDSPSFKIKEDPFLQTKGGYLSLNTEGYGGMLCATWLDRPLSIAGRVMVKENQKIVSKLLCVDRDLVLIPNVAIHMNREANTGIHYKKQVDLLPLFSQTELHEDLFNTFIGNELGVDAKDIIAKELYLYNRDRYSIWGYKNEFVSSPRLDNLECAYSGLYALIQSENLTDGINVFAGFDNEEVGSGTKQGAGSTFLHDILERITLNLGYTKEDYHCALAKSFMTSCDNSHSIHPNHPEKADPTNYPLMNKGVVIKYHANQKYTTDAISAGIFKQILDKANVPYQAFANHSDSLGGSTLGNISAQKVSVHSVDIGLAQLAMHSAYETAGIKDIEYMIRALTTFYETKIQILNDEEIMII